MHISLRLLAALILALVFAAIVGTSFLRGALHSLSLPMCWRCGADKVRRSISYCATDSFFKLLFLVPYRCRHCRSRFYGLRNDRLMEQPHG
jgi:hypothetical protein